STSDITVFSFIFFHDPLTTAIYTLSLHDALPILGKTVAGHPIGLEHVAIFLPKSEPAFRSDWPNQFGSRRVCTAARQSIYRDCRDRKSTRLNSSHVSISYAVFCLKKKKKKN